MVDISNQSPNINVFHTLFISPTFASRGTVSSDHNCTVNPGNSIIKPSFQTPSKKVLLESSPL